jgi:hypothetical protein
MRYQASKTSKNAHTRRLDAPVLCDTELGTGTRITKEREKWNMKRRHTTPVTYAKTVSMNGYRPLQRKRKAKKREQQRAS